MSKRQNRLALVTCASSWIGAAIASALVRSDFAVVSASSPECSEGT